MKQTFISYSHRDKDFARRIYSSLNDCGFPIWIDEFIEKSSPWREEVLIALQAAFNVIFIISPDSINSAECGDELKQALRLNKRIIPILYRDIDISQCPKPLSEIQWIYFNTEYYKAIQQLIESLNSPLGLPFGSGSDIIHSKLTITYKDRIREIHLNRKRYLLGRNPPESLEDAGLIFSYDPAVSATHATIELHNRWQVIDGYLKKDVFGKPLAYRASRNGLRFNHELSNLKQGQWRTLIHGDRIRLSGDTSLNYFESYASNSDLLEKSIDPRETLPEI